MRKQFYAFLMSVALISFTVGCDTGATPAGNSGGDQTHSDDDGHDHGADDGHDHEGEHAHEGPHDGTVVEWGEHEFHVEFIVDHEQKQATAYILGEDVKTPMPINTTEITVSIKEPAIQIVLKANPMDGETEGKSSRFVGSHDGLATVKDYEGAISGAIDGTPYSANFKEAVHEH